MVQDKINFINKTLFKRLITLSFLFPVFIYCILINNFFSKFIILLTAIILSYEWFNMTQKKNMLNLIFFKFLIFINLYISINLSFTSSLVTTIFFSFFLFLLTQIKKKN